MLLRIVLVIFAVLGLPLVLIQLWSLRRDSTFDPGPVKSYRLMAFSHTLVLAAVAYGAWLGRSDLGGPWTAFAIAVFTLLATHIVLLLVQSHRLSK